jgi:hypothetical protein
MGRCKDLGLSTRILRYTMSRRLNLTRNQAEAAGPGRYGTEYLWSSRGRGTEEGRARVTGAEGGFLCTNAEGPESLPDSLIILRENSRRILLYLFPILNLIYLYRTNIHPTDKAFSRYHRSPPSFRFEIFLGPLSPEFESLLVRILFAEISFRIPINEQVMGQQQQTYNRSKIPSTAKTTMRECRDNSYQLHSSPSYSTIFFLY